MKKYLNTSDFSEYVVNYTSPRGIEFKMNMSKSIRIIEWLRHKFTIRRRISYGPIRRISYGPISEEKPSYCYIINIELIDPEAKFPFEYGGVTPDHATIQIVIDKEIQDITIDDILDSTSVLSTEAFSKYRKKLKRNRKLEKLIN